MSGTKELAEILFVLIVLVSVIQLLVFWISYRRLAYFKPRQPNVNEQPVSVIICARNEAERLKKYLPSILNQEYSSYEVIVVNDCSWDETDLVLMEFNKQYKNLKIVTINEQEKYKHGKKFALTLGIKAASNELLLLTDADCMPSSSRWLSLMQGNFISEIEFVLGYSPAKSEPGFLNKLIRFDTFMIAIQYLSAALAGKAYMGVGRNLAYKKSVFFRNKGFARHNHLLSGDDDLFVNDNANDRNVTIEINPDTFTYTEPKKSFSAWMSQKKRHLSTSGYYKTSHQTALFVKNTSLILFYLFLIPLFLLQFDWRILVSLYAFIFLLKTPIIYKITTKLKEKDLFWIYPILEIIYAFLMPLFYIANLLTKQKTWK